VIIAVGRKTLPGKAITANTADGGTLHRLARCRRQPQTALPRRRKNNAWLHTRTAALNLRRLLNLGLARRDGAWILT